VTAQTTRRAPATTRTRAATRPWATWVTAALLVVAAVFGVLAFRNVLGGHEVAGRAPQSAGMEAALGVRITRVAVVGDGGLVTVSYLVLDSEKAGRFQSDTQHPPELRSEARTGGTHRVSLMKQGHELRAGQTYYLVYQNSGGAIRPGETVTVVAGGLRLRGFPVL
jgi:hypothetical protein